MEPENDEYSIEACSDDEQADLSLVFLDECSSGYRAMSFMESLEL